MKKIKSYVVTIRNLLLMSWYILNYEKSGLKHNWILVDSKQGADLGSNMLRFVEELTCNPSYKKYIVFVACTRKKKRKIKGLLNNYSFRKAWQIKEGGFLYARIAAKAKYLFTDTSFPVWYIKKDGQIITNTWHGTPLKKMGRDVNNRAFSIGNVQKNHLIADYLIYPNRYMKCIMTQAYCLENVFQGNMLYSGYPRNSIFFKNERSEKIKKELNINSEKVYGFMPTWRGTLNKIDHKKYLLKLEYYFMLLDEQLRLDELFLVKLHPFISGEINYSKYRCIRPFPMNYDPYEILNVCDLLVTDYSSVFFDFANTRRKIILFVPDKEVYMEERGMYITLDSLPFPQARSIPDLVKEMRLPKKYNDETFIKKYCEFDGPQVVRDLCEHILKGKKVYENQKMGNGKENVLLFVSSLKINGLTSAMQNLFANIDLEKRNYYAAFVSECLKEEPLRVQKIPHRVGLIPITAMKWMTFGERIVSYLYFEKNRENFYIKKKLGSYFKRLYKRNYNCCNFSTVIQYSGYDSHVIQMFMQADAKKIIFVHNDMEKEISIRKNLHRLTLQKAYKEYDWIAPVTEDICPQVITLGGVEKKIWVVNNCHDEKSVISKSKEKIMFDYYTVSNCSISRLEKILEGKGTKICTIGRFSPEKGHNLLITAFHKYWLENKESYLIIIGGLGKIFDQTVNSIEYLESKENIIMIRAMSNPMTILGRCDLFVLSSLYEGLGLVILEADTLGIPVISTDIPGPRGFMKRYGGYLAKPDADGIYDGLLAYDVGKINKMMVDYHEYNKIAVEQFEELLKRE